MSELFWPTSSVAILLEAGDTAAVIMADLRNRQKSG